LLIDFVYYNDVTPTAFGIGVGGGVKVVEKRRFENPAGVSLERSNFAMLI